MFAGVYDTSFLFGGFCIGVMLQGTGTGHHLHLCPAALVVCSGVAPPAPAHRRSLELKLLLGSLLHRHVFPFDIHYFFKCGKKVYFGFPRNVRVEFGLVFPVMGAVCSCLRVGNGSLFPFVFFSGILAPLPLWLSDALHMLCSCTLLLVASSLLPGTAMQCFCVGLLSDIIVKENISPSPTGAVELLC